MSSKFFGDVEKDVLYNALVECGADFASKNGRDPKEEDVVLSTYFLENLSGPSVVEILVDKLHQMGYGIDEHVPR